jgi:D-methionine transport system substrate-binding protein
MSPRRLIIAALAASLLAASPLATTGAAAEKIKVAVTGGPPAQVMEVVKGLAAKKGLEIELVEFSDYVLPNAALDAGEVQANAFQHQPYLDNQVRDRKLKIVSVGQTYTVPLGIYSKKYKSWADIPTGASIAIPNDPTNGGRALLLLQAKGAIKLKPSVGLKPTPLDIVDNPRKLKIVEIDAAQTPRSLDDVAAAAINTNYAAQAGLNPNKDAILIEDPNGPYVNVIAVRTVDKDKPWVKILVESYRSPEVKAFMLEKFKGALLPSW